MIHLSLGTKLTMKRHLITFPPLEDYLKIVNAGLGLISVGVLLCLLLWVLYANHPQREEVFVKIPLSIKGINSCRSSKTSSRHNGNNEASL